MITQLTVNGLTIDVQYSLEEGYPVYLGDIEAYTDPTITVEKVLIGENDITHIVKAFELQDTVAIIIADRMEEIQ
jgi:hypothetical protein